MTDTETAGSPSQLHVTIGCVGCSCWQVHPLNTAAVHGHAWQEELNRHACMHARAESSTVLVAPGPVPALSPQGFIPRGVDQSYLSGFVAREIERAAARAADTSTNSSSSSRGGGGGGSGAVLLSDVVARFGQLMGVDHWALALHKLAELQQEGLAGSEQVTWGQLLSAKACWPSVAWRDVARQDKTIQLAPTHVPCAGMVPDTPD